MQKIKIGTRNSALALWQANYIGCLLENKGFSYELIAISTKGDQILDRSLSKIGSKGVFTQELEEMLRTGEIDIAQHSAKDLPSTLPSDLELIAFTERENAQDVVLSLEKDFRLSNAQSKIIGTSSTRRRAFLQNKYPQHTLVDMRGNLQTRLDKLKNGSCDAMILAFAGVHRMEMEAYISEHLKTEEFVPAVGQGSVAIQSSSQLDPTLKQAIREACNHTVTEKCLLAERTLLSKLDGGCSVPVYGHATMRANLIYLTAGVLSLNGEIHLMETETDTDPIELGNKTASILIEKGAQELLKEIRQQLSNE
ncbi:hydroxymethylbilane synthase [Aquirufa sp. ROCK2-A2]